MIPKHSVSLIAEYGSRLRSWLAHDDEDVQDLKQYGRQFKKAKKLRVTTVGSDNRCTKEYKKNTQGAWYEVRSR